MALAKCLFGLKKKCYLKNYVIKYVIFCIKILLFNRPFVVDNELRIKDNTAQAADKFRNVIGVHSGLDAADKAMLSPT